MYWISFCEYGIKFDLNWVCYIIIFIRTDLYTWEIFFLTLKYPPENYKIILKTFPLYFACVFICYLFVSSKLVVFTSFKKMILALCRSQASRLVYVPECMVSAYVNVCMFMLVWWLTLFIFTHRKKVSGKLW